MSLFFLNLFNLIVFLFIIYFDLDVNVILIGSIIKYAPVTVPLAFLAKHFSYTHGSYMLVDQLYTLVYFMSFRNV